ncbi:MAG: acriflavin resistance protein [Cellvibrionales bacterium TMED49]|nr:acriflavin resistance protein [Porticoccaceae bacterium]OUU38292.1 MAG: acriflavin resistance protein [Cellvibrionales bacterium TMED49]
MNKDRAEIPLKVGVINSLIKTPKVTLFIMFLVLSVGVFAFKTLPVEMEPDIQIPVFLIVVQHEGISSEDGARLLITPIESELKNLDGVKEIIGTSRDDSIQIIVEFEIDRQAKGVLTDLRNAVERASTKFPEDTEEPIIEEISIRLPEVVVAFSAAGESHRELDAVAKYFEAQFEKLPHVLEAKLGGYREEVLEISLMPERLRYYQVTLDEILNIFSVNNLVVPAGQLDAISGLFSIKVPALIEDERDVRGIPIKSSENGVLKLGDVAQIARKFKDASGFSTVNGIDAITLDVMKRPGANSIETVQLVRDLVTRDRHLFSQNINIDFLFDSAPYSRALVDELTGNILTAMALVLILVVATLGFQSGILVTLAVPFCLLGSLVIILFLGYSYNFVVMFGLLLSLGMLIDGAIVVVEFADARMATGTNASDAYKEAVERMRLPIGASIGTTLAAFSPLLFWPGTTGKFMAYMPVTVFAVLLWSLLYALIFAPTLGVVIERSVLSNGSKNRSYASKQPLGGFLTYFYVIYLKLLREVINRPLITVALLLTFLLSVFLGYVKFGIGSEFFTETEHRFGTISVRAQGNLSVSQKRGLTDQVLKSISKFDEIKKLHATSGGGWLIRKDTSKDQISIIFVELTPSRERALSSAQVFAKIRVALGKIPGVNATGQNLDNGPPVGKDLQLQVSSKNRDEMYRTADRIKQWISKNVDGFRDLEDTIPIAGVQWEFRIDRSLASMTDVNVKTLGQSIQLVTNGLPLSYFRPDDAEEEVEISLRYPKLQRNFTELDGLLVNSALGSVPIGIFTERRPVDKIDTINRLDMQESVMVMAFSEKGFLIDDQIRQINAWLKNADIPHNVEVKFRGVNEEQAESANFLLISFGTALGLMLVLMLAHFNSFYQTFLILFSVVISTAGVLLGLLVGKDVFSITLTGIGIVALAGIVVNNNIVLLHTYNYIRKKTIGITPEMAVFEATKSRFRPIILTSTTTIVGLLPLANGFSIDIVNRSWERGGMVVSWWQPLASAIVDGLLLSTVMTLLLTPALLVLPSRIYEMTSMNTSIANGR